MTTRLYAPYGGLPTPTLQDLLSEGKRSISLRCSDPSRLGSHLNIPKTVLDQIDKNNPDDILTNLLWHYIQRSPEPSWIDITRALFAIGEEIEAQKIMRKFNIGSLSNERKTCQYEAVLESWEDLPSLLAGGPDQILLYKFEEKGWVTEPGPDPDVRGMIDIALNRISSNVSHHNTFIGMLQDIPQAKNFVEEVRLVEKDDDVFNGLDYPELQEIYRRYLRAIPGAKRSIQHSGREDLIEAIVDQRIFTVKKIKESRREWEEYRGSAEGSDCATGNTDQTPPSLWNKKEVNVLFMNRIPSEMRNERGNTISKEEVLQIANEWNHCGPEIVPTFIECADSESSDIRVEFIDEGESRSVVGQPAKDMSKDEPTMWLNLTPTEVERDDELTPKRYKHMIQHEFGHVLGLHHEHQHPDAPPLFKDTILRYLKKEDWEKISSTLWGTVLPYDPYSVMHFVIPERVRLQNYVGPTVMNWELSTGDKKRIVKLYSVATEGDDEGKVVEEFEVLEMNEEEFKLFMEAMKEGRVDAGEGLLILLGVTGSGKTEFKRIVLCKKVPKNSPSTPLASRPVSVCNTKVDGVDWKEMGPKEMLAMVAEKMNQRRMQNVNQVPPQQVDPGNVATERETAVPALEDGIREEVEGKGGSEGGGQGGAKQELTGPEVKTEGEQNVGTKEQENSMGFGSEVDAALKEIDVELIQAMREASKGDTDPGKLMRVDLIYLLDSGGQPPFREILPHFVQQATAVVLMQKLNERLDYKPTIRYREKGGKVDKGYTSQLTNEQILQQYVQAVQSHRSKVFVIGTHRDKEHECKDETRKDKNDKLRKSFGEVLKEQLMLYEPGELMFPLNCRSRKKADKLVAEIFKERVMAEFKKLKPSAIPMPWFVLKQLLQLLAGKIDVSVLSVVECCKAAKWKLHMSEESCKLALKHLGRLNIIFYRPDILPGVVFSNVQVILDKITELVHCSHALRPKEETIVYDANENDEDLDEEDISSGNSSEVAKEETGETPDANDPNKTVQSSEAKEKSSGDSNEALEYESESETNGATITDPVPDAMKTDRGEEFRDFGRVDSELLERAFPSHYREGLFTAPDLLLLLERMLIAGRLGSGDHFIPSLLPDLPVEEIAEYRATADHPPPLVIYYSKMWLPVGVISSLVVYLQNECGWVPKQKEGTPTCMHHNCIQFRLPRRKPGDVVLIDSTKFLEIHIRPRFDLDCSLLFKIRDDVLAGLKAAHRSLHYDPPEIGLALLCSSDECPVKRVHLATLDDDKVMWECSKDPDLCGEIEDRQRLWFKSIPQDEEIDKKCNNKVIAVEDFSEVRRVLEPVKKRWKQIGVGLGLDLGTLKKWKEQEEEDADKYLGEMVSLWENKKYNVERFGEPSWELLARVVRDPAGGNEPTVADEIITRHAVDGSYPLNHEGGQVLPPGESDKEQQRQGTEDATLRGESKTDQGTKETKETTTIISSGEADSAVAGSCPLNSEEGQVLAPGESEKEQQRQGTEEEATLKCDETSNRAAVTESSTVISDDVTVTQLSTKPPPSTPPILDIDDHFDVMDEVHDVAHRWKSLGAALRLPRPNLDIIHEKQRGDPGKCLEDVISEWLKQSYNTERHGLPTWKMLVDAVAHRNGGNDCALASKIATKYNV